MTKLDMILDLTVIANKFRCAIDKAENFNDFLSMPNLLYGYVEAIERIRKLEKE